MRGEERIDDIHDKLGRSHLAEKDRTEEWRASQAGHGSVHVKIRRKPTCRDTGIDYLPERIQTPPHHVTVRTTRLTTQPRSVDSDGHESCPAPPSYLLPHVGQQPDQVGAHIAGQRDRNFRFLGSNGVSKQVLSVRPMPIDRCPGDARCFTDAQCSYRISAFHLEELAGCFEHDFPSAGHPRITPTRSAPAAMASMSPVFVCHIYNCTTFCCKVGFGRLCYIL